MRKSYIMVFSSSFADRKQVTDYLDEIGPDWDWQAEFPNCVFFTSELSAWELAKMFENKFGIDMGKMFVIAPVIGSESQGRLTERAWRLLNDPRNPRGR